MRGSVTARFPPSSSIAYGLGTMVERGCWIGRCRAIARIRRAHRRQGKRSICRRLNVSCIGLRCPPSRGMFSPTLTLHVRTPRVPLPMPATDCLAKLGEQRFTTSEEMLTALMSAARGPAAVSRTKRAVHLSLCAIPTILMLVLGLLSAYRLSVLPRQDTARPDIAELAACLSRLEVMENRGVPSTDPQYRALELYIAGRHRDLISNPPIWSASLFAQRVISSQQRALATRVVATLPCPQKADVDEAARILRPFLDNVRSGVRECSPIRSARSTTARWPTEPASKPTTWSSRSTVSRSRSRRNSAPRLEGIPTS